MNQKNEKRLDMKNTEQIAVTLSFQNGPTSDEVHAFILALSDKLTEDRSKVRLDDCWGLKTYDTKSKHPALTFTEK